VWLVAMKSRRMIRAISGVVLVAIGVWLAVPTPYREKNYLIDAGGCRMETAIVEPRSGVAQGAVLLFHGISANKKVMSYLAHGFAEQGLRVYVADLPGHGRTPGPFSPARAEQCGDQLLLELLARGMIQSNHTILAGHSMGAAIAERIASRVSVAGLIAVSPAPMRAAHGLSPEVLLYNNPPKAPPNSLVLVGSLELRSLRENAADLVATQSDGTSKYVEIPRASHVTVLFSDAAMRASQEWAAQVLHLTPTTILPSHWPIVGALGGFMGIVLLAGPFLREVAGKKSEEAATVATAEAGARTIGGSAKRIFLEFAAASVLIVVLLRFWIPLKAAGLFQGDYLASFLLILGVVLTALHARAIAKSLRSFPRDLLLGGFAGILLLLLSTAWFNLTFYETWLTGAKWLRFPLLLFVILLYLLAEETLLGPVESTRQWRRLAMALGLRLISWAAMMAGILLLHSGEILIGLLGGYFALFNLVQRRGMDIVHQETGSAGAAAVFGAILLAGFCLVIFPLT
jgi:alpha-beta hydrolase superfamily lysophospholipase